MPRIARTEPALAKALACWPSRAYLCMDAWNNSGCWLEKGLEKGGGEGFKEPPSSFLHSVSSPSPPLHGTYEFLGILDQVKSCHYSV